MHVDNPTDIELVTAPEIAKSLAVSKQMIYLLAERGEIPHYRIGKSVRFDRREVLTSLSRFRSEPMAAGGRR